MTKSPYDFEFREKIVKEYLNGDSGPSLANKYGIDDATIYRWVNKYLKQGVEALEDKVYPMCYTAEFKKMCVETYLDGNISLYDVCIKYGISSDSVLRDWIKRYNANRELKDYCPNTEVYMAGARRKTTIEERREIVEYCITHNRDYKGTASIYDVSYNQVYSWVKKYDANGDEGLTDKRGHHKTDDEVDELERLRRENVRLKRQLEEKDMLTELLKKVQELEGM